MSENAVADKKTKLISQDSGSFSALMDTAKFEHLWRVATAFSRSDLVPEHYRGKIENTLITLQMAVRLKVDPMMLLQNTYIVHGTPGMKAQLAIALINSSAIFDEPLQYELEGSVKEKMRCRAWTIRKGKRLDGPW